MTEDTDLLAELRADSRPTSPGCKVCAWLEGRDDAAKWDEAFAAPREEITAVAISRKMTSLGYRYKGHTVETHRNESHRVSA